MRAVVTGASGGLGLEFARLLAADKHDLVLIARSGDKLEALAHELRAAHGVNVESIAADLGTVDAAARVVERIPACDILVNNAGFGKYGPFDAMPPAETREELLLDVITLTELTRAYLPGMLARNSGRILNLASTAAFAPGPFGAVYYAAKAYVLSFSQAISEEVRGTGVTVTCLCPGPTATNFASQAGIGDSPLFTFGVMSASQVAKEGYAAMLRGNDLVIPGWLNKLIAYSPRISPRRLVLWISRKLLGR